MPIISDYMTQLHNIIDKGNRPFKVLQLGKFYPIRGGVEKVMYDHMLALSEHGVECDMLCALSQGESSVLRLNERARLIACRTWVKAYATTLAPSMIVRLFCMKKEYDLIHVHHPDPMACVALLLSGYRGKVVLHWHSDIEKQKWLLKLYRPLQRWLIKRADRIVGTTPVYTAESPCLTDVQQKVRTLPIGIDPVVPQPEAVERMRSRYQGRKIVFSLGRMVAYKGFRYLVEAARYLSDDYVVVIGGEGPLRAELEALIEHWHLQEKVFLPGRVSDEELPAYYGACEVFCLSSVQKTEAFGIVQLEAMSCGKPVVATCIPHSGVSWVNAHGESGLNVPPADARALADAIRTLTEDEAVYRRYSEGAAQRYRHLFTREINLDKLLNIYLELWKSQK